MATLFLNNLTTLPGLAPGANLTTMQEFTLYCTRVIGWHQQPGSEWTEEVTGTRADAEKKRLELIAYHGDPDTQDGQTPGTGCGINVSIAS